mmetsp:Transcript_24593/g.57746  ORF Transcript_24593/g.57746 Transcript_24593/m.57746 type:complete len:519 (+) Transcript_24593:131-1687(+)
MDCSSCGKRISKCELVHVFDRTCNEYQGGSSRKVCDICLVGYEVPVLRPSTGKWEIGTVLSYDSSSQRSRSEQKQHRLQFMNGIKEWAIVNTEPYEAYAQYFDDLLDEINLQGKIQDCSSLGTGNSFSRPVIDSDCPDRYQYHYRCDIDQKYDLKEIHSSSNEFEPLIFNPSNVLSFDDECYHTECSEPLFTTKNPSQEVSSLNEESEFNYSSKKREVQENFSPKESSLFPDIRQYFVRKVGLDSPSNSHISSLSTCSPTSSSSAGSRNGGTGFPGGKNRIPKLWTRSEDKLLLNSIASKDNKLCWPKIALDIPDRTGKQCRERYLNHLGPHLKQTGWSAIEDATIFRLYSLYGSKWSHIAGTLPGRTDNGVKNRFHYLRRRFEKRMKLIPDSKELRLLMKHMKESDVFRRLSNDHFVTKDTVRILATLSTVASTKQHSILGDDEYKFGPFESVTQSSVCGRCGLVIPSRETGTVICCRTRWCQTCTEVPLVITSDLLRAFHIIIEEMTREEEVQEET